MMAVTETAQSRIARRSRWSSCGGFEECCSSAMSAYCACLRFLILVEVDCIGLHEGDRSIILGLLSVRIGV
jgi:hypothetical protein